MATVNNIRGTSYPSFGIGKRGITIHQGTVIPDQTLGNAGDLYVQHGSDQKLYIKKTNWVEFSPASGSIVFFDDLVPVNGSFIGTDSNGLVLRSLAQTKSSLNLGTASDLDAGTLEGQIPVLTSNGKLPNSTIPSIAITDVYVVADETEMDALVAEVGDVAILQNGSSYIFDGLSWIEFGHSSGVQAIQTSTTPKTGIVSLDAQDILSGVLSVARGGTGFTTYSTGDMLIGNSGSLNKLTIGTTGKVLISNGTTAVWGDVIAEDISVTPYSSSKLTSTDVNSAIFDLESITSSVSLKTIDPVQSDDTSKKYKVGDIWYNGSSKALFINRDATTNNAIWSRLNGDMLFGNAKFVAKTGNDSVNDGSIQRPFITIQTAIDNLMAGGVVFVFPGTYEEEVTVSGNNIELIGFQASILGKLTVTGDNFTSNIPLSNTTEAPLILNGAQDVKINHDVSVPSSDAIVISGNTGLIEINSSIIQGNVNVQSSSQNPIVINSSEGFTTSQLSGNLIIRNSRKIGNVSHQGGNISLENVSQIVSTGGNSFVSYSSSNIDKIIFNNVSTLQDDGNYGAVVIPNASFKITNVDFPTSSLAESNKTYGISARDIKASFTPTNYTPSNVSVTAHLQAIDSQLNSGTGGASSYNDLTDVTNYVMADANKILVVNSTGTGITFGGILGTASTYNAHDFASSIQGSKADSAVQPEELNTSAFSGNNKLTNMLDFPSSYTGKSLRILRVKEDETGVEIAPAISTVAYTGSYLDLTNTPTLGSAASKNTGILSGNVPVLDSDGKLPNSVIPDIALTSVNVVADLDERDALTVQSGDVAIVSSNSTNYIYTGTQWVVLNTSTGVLSVNGSTGALTLNGQNLSTSHTAINYTTTNEFLTSHIDGIDTKLGGLNTSVVDLDSRLDTTEATLTTAVQNISTLTTDISTINGTLVDTISKNSFDAAGDLLVGTGNNTFVALSKGTNGQVLSSTSSGLQWIDPAASTVTDLDSLSDVVITTPSNGQVLTFNGTNWINGSAPASGETNTISNTGSSAGVSLIQTTSKVGSDLRIRNIINGSNKLAISTNDTNQTVVIDLALANISLGDLTGTLTPTRGGTGITSYNSGDILYASAANTLSALTKGTDGQVLTLSSGIPSWSTLSVSSDNITSSTTSVKTNEVTNTVTVNSRGNRVANFYSDATVFDSEQIKVVSSSGKVTLSTANTSTSGDVNLVFAPQGNGSISFVTTGTPTISSSNAAPITIKPGSSSTADGGQVTISGGDTTFTTGTGGSLLLKPGTSGASGSAGQVLLPSGYTATSVNSLVPKSYIDGLKLNQLQTPTASINAGGQLITNVATPVNGTDAANRSYVLDRVGYRDTVIVTSGSTYSSTSSNNVILIKKDVAGAITVQLPSTTSLSVGKVIIVKDAKGDASTNNITITGAASETIDGQSNFVLNTNYSSKTFLWNGTEWSMI